METPSAVSDKRFWIAAGLALLLAILLIAALAQTKLPGSAQSQSASPPTATPAPLHLSPADAARRAAIAKLGPIDAHPVGNGAELYAHAMTLYNELTDEEKEALMNWRKKMDPAAAAALSAKIQPIIQLLRDARTAGQFDWGPDPLSLSTRHPRLNAMQDLSSVATWEANYRFQSDPDGALQVLAADEVLNQNGGQTLGGFGTYTDLRENIAAVIAANANALSSTQSADLAFLTNPANAIAAAQNILSGQSVEVQTLLDQYANPATRQEAAQVMEVGLTPLIQTSLGAQPNVSTLKWIAQTDQQFANTIGQPDAQFQQWLAQVQTSAAGMPFGQSAIATIQDQRGYLETYETQDAMIAAGMAMIQGNQTQTTQSNPFTSQPLTVTNLPQGFRLTTKSTSGTPITLTFGTGQ